MIIVKKKNKKKQKKKQTNKKKKKKKKKKKTDQTPLQPEMNWSKEFRQKSPLGINGLIWIVFQCNNSTTV